MLNRGALQSVIRKRLQLVAQKAVILQVQQKYAFNERRACHPMPMA